MSASPFFRIEYLWMSIPVLHRVAANKQLINYLSLKKDVLCLQKFGLFP